MLRLDITICRRSLKVIVWKSRLIWLTIGWSLIVAAARASAQSAFTSGFYRITSGRYVECCGIAGPFNYLLPDTNQTFIELIVSADGASAQMTFLGEDTQTVFSSYPWIGNSAFTFTFSNGMVFPDHIQFGDLLPNPPPGFAFWSYT